MFNSMDEEKPRLSPVAKASLTKISVLGLSFTTCPRAYSVLAKDERPGCELTLGGLAFDSWLLRCITAFTSCGCEGIAATCNRIVWVLEPGILLLIKKKILLDEVVNALFLSINRMSLDHMFVALGSKNSVFANPLFLSLSLFF